MKLIILALLGLLVGLGGGSAAAVMKAKKAFAAATAVRAKFVADSLAKVEEATKTKTQSAEAHADSVPADGGGPTQGEATATEVAKVDAPKGEPSKGEGVKAPAKAATAAPKAGEHVAAGGTSEHAPTAATRGAVTTKEAKPAEFDKTKWNRAVATVESHGTPAGDAAASKPHLPALPPKPMAAPASAATTPPPSTSKVAKIFAAMPAKDAAKVMEQLDDTDVQAIIASVSEKQAAAILQNFPPARAAAISKAVMRSALVKP